VSAKIPNAIVKMTANTAEGMFKSCACPIELENLLECGLFEHMVKHSRKPEIGDDGRLVKGKTSGANREEGPA
jgi:hypothetical protein